MRLVFQRIIPLIICFAKQNIEFTDSSSNLYDPSGKNGNYQQMIHAVAKFDNVLKEHIEYHKSNHYYASIGRQLYAILEKSRAEPCFTFPKLCYCDSVYGSTLFVCFRFTGK